MRILTAVFAVALLLGVGMMGCNKNKSSGTTPANMPADGGGTQSQSFTPPPAQ